MHFVHRFSRLLAVTALLGHMVATFAQAAPGLTTIHQFGAAPAPTTPIYTHLLDNGAGVFYGLSSGGGGSGAGTVFTVTPAGASGTVVHFGDLSDPLGAFPTGSLMRASDGHFYGLTRTGGASSMGTLFRMTTAGEVTTLVEFDGTHGSFPTGSLIEGQFGLYGMTTAGGAADKGTIFRMSLSGIPIVMVEFDDNTYPGAAPHGSLLLGGDGNFYGMTRDGGANGKGTIFKMTITGAFNTIVNFNDNVAPKGAAPFGSLVASGGNLYGMTSAGGAGDFGTIFRMTTGGVLTTLAEFDGEVIPGINPYGSLMVASDGNLYGLTSAGGADGAGTVFKLDPTVPAPAPEIGIFQPDTTSLVDGSSTVSFEPVDISFSSVLTFTITNSGNASLTGIAVTIDGANAGDFTVSAAPPVSLAAGSSASFDVTFTASAGGIRTAALHVTSNDGNESPFDINLSGIGITPGASLSFDGVNDIVSLGDQPELGFDRNTPFTIELWYKTSSTAIQPLVSKLSSVGAFRGYEIYVYEGRVYVLLNNIYNANMILLATTTAPSYGVWHHLAVTYNGSSSASGVKIYVDGVAQNVAVSADTLTATFAEPVSANLGGRGGGPYYLNGSLDEVRFWNRTLDQCEIQYQRNAELTGTEAGLVAYYKFNEGSAFVDNGSSTTLPNSVADGGDGTLSNFALNGPTSNWVIPGGVVSGSSVAPYTAPEIGLLGGTPRIAIAKGDITPAVADGTDFETVTNGIPLQRTFVITNSGNSSLVVSSVSKSGAHQADYTVSGINLPATIAAGASSNFVVTFNPSASGVRAATITIISTDCDEASYDFALQGTGLAPEIAVHQPFGTEISDGGSRSFGNVQAGDKTTLLFVITNSGTANLTGLGITFSGTDQSMFTVVGSPFAPLATNDITTFTIQFAPVGTGLKSAVLRIASNDGDENPYDITLTGTGTTPQPEIAVASSALSVEITKGDNTPSLDDDTHFGSAAVSGPGSSTLHFFTIVNSGLATLNVSSITVSGANAADFVVAGAPSSVPAQNSAQFSITFDPSAVGIRKAVVTIVNSDGDEGTFDFAVEGAGDLAVTQIHAFAGATSDGARPRYIQLLQTANGVLYGTTEYGGLNDKGTVFKSTTNGPATVLAQFSGNDGTTKGANPYGGLALGTDGLLYGTTYYGGSSAMGTVFKLTTNGTFTTLVEFTGTSGANLGAHPNGRLIRSADGTFYGTTSDGGASGRGTIFKITTNGVLTTIVQFTGGTGARIGAYPYGALAFGADGLLYGTTSDDSILNRHGTIFKVDTNGANYSVLTSFTGTSGAAKGYYPWAGLTLGSDGQFYGTTAGDNAGFHGTVFKVTTNGTFTHLVEFTGQYGDKRGSYATGELVAGNGGVLYGGTTLGGFYSGGTLFQINTSGAFTNLVDFGDANGVINQGTWFSGALLVGQDGLLYGGLDLGGAGFSGLLFKLNVSSVTPAAAQPVLSVILSSGNALVRWAIAGSSGFSLEQNSTSIANPNNWSVVGAGSISNDGTTNTATIPATGFKFFRLRKP